MRRLASEILQDLEIRVARLEKKSAWSGYDGTVWENDDLEKLLIRTIYKKYNERVPFNEYEVIQHSRYESDQFDHKFHYVTFNDYHFIVKNYKGNFGISFISANPFTAQHKWNDMTMSRRASYEYPISGNKITLGEGTVEAHGGMRWLSYTTHSLLKKESVVQIDVADTNYSSLTGAKMKKLLIEGMIHHTEGQLKGLHRQNERTLEKIEDIKGTGKRISKAKKEEIKRQMRMSYTKPEVFEEIEDGLADFKKIKVSKKGAIFLVR
jgi:hypothetical protein